MSKGTKIVLMLSMLVLMSGCIKENEDMKNVTNNNSVNDILQEQISQAEEQDTQENTESESIVENVEIDDVEVNNNEKVEEDGKSTAVAEDDEKEESTITEDVDYDLSKMDSNMVYSVVWQMMSNPEEYIGKSFRVKGLYTASWYEPTQQYYHYVVLKDAQACCAQGLEFVWEDGNHVYPEEYPAEETQVEIVGVFETYREEGSEYLYCRLKNASLQILE